MFSEPVLPAAAGAGGLVSSAADLSGLLTATSGGSAVNGQVSYLESAPGFGLPFGTLVRFTPSSSPSGTVVLDIAANQLFDSAGNGNIAQPVPVPLAGTSGVRFTGVVSDTRPNRTPASTVGNPFRFQGQYAELDLGLIYMRARFYDPLTGTFLERDPEEYEDSVNLYAGLAQNPASNRDPTGMAIGGRLLGKISEAARRLIGRRVVTPVMEEAAEAGGRYALGPGVVARERIVRPRSQAARVFDDVTEELPIPQLPNRTPSASSVTAAEVDDVFGSRVDNVFGSRATAAPPRQETEILNVADLMARGDRAGVLVPDVARRLMSDVVFVNAHANPRRAFFGIRKKSFPLPDDVLKEEIKRVLQPGHTRIVLSACNAGVDVANGLATRVSRLFPEHEVFAAVGTVYDVSQAGFASMAAGHWRKFIGGNLVRDRMSNALFNSLIVR
jgi:RHS repeat-associated protein